MRKLIFILAISTPLFAFAKTTPSKYYGEDFPYAQYIERNIKLSEDPLHIPYDRASGESEIESDEQRHWYWSGWWHAMNHLQWQSKYHYHTR